MKSTKFLAIAFIAVASVTSQVVAQETTEINKNNANERTSGYDVKMNTKLRMIATSSGCDIVCENVGSGGEVTDIKQVKSVIFDKGGEDGSVTQDENKDSSGQAVGKGTPQDLHFSKKYDNASPVISKTGSGIVSMQDFHFTMKSKGKNIPVSSEDGVCTLPDNLPDGDYILSCDWSWGAHNGGTSSQKSCDCHLKLEGGVCVDMAINEKGTAGTKSPK
jgi:hypothetical protein